MFAAYMRSHLPCRRLLHSVMVVADLDEEQNFLKDVLGMRSLRARTLPNGAKQGFSGAIA